MQIATLNYNYGSKDNATNEARPKQRHRHVMTSVIQNQRKQKQRQSFVSEQGIYSSVPLPPIITNGKRPSSIRIKGSSLTSTKVTEVSVPTAEHHSRSRSRNSNQSDRNGRQRSRSISPGAVPKSSSKFVRLKFGYPVTLRSAEFYGSEKNDDEIRIREASFVNDSIRSAHQSRRRSIIPPYEPLADPHLRHFFQSPIVLDVVRKTMSLEQSASYKSDDRLSNISKSKARSKTNDPNDYHRIVTKGSSGYGKLNGYDCIPPSSPARHHSRRSGAFGGSASNLAHHRSTDSRLYQPVQADKTRASTNTSVNSFPTSSSHQATDSEKKKSARKTDRFKPPKPVSTSSPLRHPLRQLTEEATPLGTDAPKETASTVESLIQQRSDNKTIDSHGSQD